MKQDKAEKIIQKAERKAAKAAKQVELAGKKAEAAKQKQAARAEKKAAQVAQNAEKKAAKHAKKAEQATKKAQLAAQKAQEKQAKVAAKIAAKALEGEEDGAGGKKKKGKKKLLLILIPVAVAAIGAGAFFFLKGGGEEEEAPLEPIPIPLEYLLNEVPITALPVTGDEVLVYQEEVPPEPPAEPEAQDGGKDEAGTPGEDGGAPAGEEGGEEEPAAAPAEEELGFTKILYRYEGLKNPRSLATAYAAVMSTEDAGFSLVDETLLRIDPPEELSARGSLQLARNVPKAEDGTGGGVHSLLLDWGGSNCAVGVGYAPRGGDGPHTAGSAPPAPPPGGGAGGFRPRGPQTGIVGPGGHSPLQAGSPRRFHGGVHHASPGGLCPHRRLRVHAGQHL